MLLSRVICHSYTQEAEAAFRCALRLEPPNCAVIASINLELIWKYYEGTNGLTQVNANRKSQLDDSRNSCLTSRWSANYSLFNREFRR